MKGGLSGKSKCERDLLLRSIKLKTTRFDPHVDGFARSVPHRRYRLATEHDETSQPLGGRASTEHEDAENDCGQSVHCMANYVSADTASVDPDGLSAELSLVMYGETSIFYACRLIDYIADIPFRHIQRH